MKANITIGEFGNLYRMDADGTCIVTPPHAFQRELWASAGVAEMSDDDLVATARRLGIPDPFGLTRTRLREMVAERMA